MRLRVAARLIIIESLRSLGRASIAASEAELDKLGAE